MGNSTETEKVMIEEPLLEVSPHKGGFRTIPFIIANESCVGAAYSGLQPNMILYLMREYHMEMATGSNIIFLWTATSFFVPVIWAVVADSWVGRYWMIGFGSVIGLMGTVAFWLTTFIPLAKPPPCNELKNNCSSPTTSQFLLLFTVLGLIATGVGGVRSSSMAFGADQLKIREGHNDDVNEGIIRRYISWYFAWWMFSIFIANSFIVYIQDKMGWKFGFGIPPLLMIFALLSFYLASSFYVKMKPASNIVSELMKVVAVSYRKRMVVLSPSTTYTYYDKEGSLLVCPSENLRFLNKACVIVDQQEDLNVDGGPKDPRSICTVDEVEALKTLIRVVPLWFTGVLMSVTLTVTSINTVEASSMTRKIGPHFEIPAGSFGMFVVLSMSLWVPFYEYIIQPIGSKILGKPFHLGIKQRMGTSILLACICMIIRAVLETIRRTIAINDGHLDDPNAVVNMSALWLIPPLCLSGFADCLQATAMNEFFYMEFPTSMSSIAIAISQFGFSIANVLASFIMSIVDDLSRSGGGDSWVSSNINKGHYDYYFFVLGCVCIVDLILFLIFSRAYGPCKGEDKPNECS